MSKHEYYLLLERLEEVNCALEGSCNDIECNKYVYRYLLKKRYKPILEHNFSYIPNLKREKAALTSLLSLSKFKKFSYKKCDVCKRKLDSLSMNCAIISFTRPCVLRGKKVYECKLIATQCKRKVKTPKGWKCLN